VRSMPRVVWIVLAGTFVNRFGSFVMPFLAIYLTRQGYSVAQAGFAVSAYGAGHLMASMLGGFLADRIGRRNTIAVSMFASAATMVALSQADSYAAIVAITVLAGAASELYRPAAGALIGDLVPPEKRITAFALYRFAVNLGFAAGPATAGLLAGRSFLYLFLGDAITSVVYGLIALLLLPHGVRSTAKEEEGEGAMRHALRNRAFVFFLAATVCVTWVEFQIHSTLPLYLTSLGFSPRDYGLLLSFNGVMIVLFELAITSWTQRFAPRSMIALGYGLAAAGVAMTGLARGMPALAMTVVVWTLGEMIYAPVTGAYVTNLAPERYRGRYHGMWVQMWSLGMLTGPSIGSWLFSRNPQSLWIACAVIGSVGAVLPLTRSQRER
ncbi:MAG TPA: MFS transporter, partial [Thermoanaerobaculia bacterium]|nr:MFS transporter [Thermoanaerobaculia bacterium]